MAEMTTSDIAARVAAGAAWLDEHRPGWWQRTNLDRLRMRNCVACVLGQEYGSYDNAPITMDLSVALGFDAEVDGSPDRPDSEFTALDEAWIALIEQRRAEAAVTS